ncbi:unnamed protein product [Timema podura]|uniref:Uncharacterized protein n=1 Tax=Timema podura TaxID=61482 RepID=A0ABN7PNE5_TIMPD|nr:unnamed protein product [Timema podura]
MYYYVVSAVDADLRDRVSAALLAETAATNDNKWYVTRPLLSWRLVPNLILFSFDRIVLFIIKLEIKKPRSLDGKWPRTRGCKMAATVSADCFQSYPLVALVIRLSELNPGPCPSGPPSCPPSKYRAPEGVCNNVRHPQWGSRGSPFLRLLPPNYQDGKYRDPGGGRGSVRHTQWGSRGSIFLTDLGRHTRLAYFKPYTSGPQAPGTS